MNETARLLAQLVAIDSVNPDLVPGGAGEAEIAHFIASWLEQAGLEIEIDEPQPGRPSVVAIARGTGGGRSLMLNAHIDTVGVAGMERPFEPYEQNGRLYGRGAFDMKGGLAAAMLAIVAAKERRLRGDVILTAVADEEHASIGTSSVVQRWHADAAIVTEATDLQVCIAHKGFIWLDVETLGVAAHGSRPEAGVDAIMKMGQVLSGLEELERELRSAVPHPLLGNGSLHASLITGGQEFSSYPERCVLGIERRTIPGETQESVEAEISRIIEQSNEADPAFNATLKTRLVRPAFEIAHDAPIVQTVSRQAHKLLGHEPAKIGAAWWMDSAILAAAGIPTVIFGPGGDGAHAAVEWVNIEKVHRCSEVLLASIEEFCA